MLLKLFSMILVNKEVLMKNKKNPKRKFELGRKKAGLRFSEQTTQ